VLLEAENTVITDRDCTGHAELNLMRLASRQFSSPLKFFRAVHCTPAPSRAPCAPGQSSGAG
jgi:tRNA(Arg) A34 adenosine deaminase TadA